MMEEDMALDRHHYASTMTNDQMRDKIKEVEDRISVLRR
jgi:hypothetical protein